MTLNRRRMRRIVGGLLGWVSVAVTAAAAAAAPMPPEPSPAGDAAVVYLFYPWSLSGVAQSASFFVDGKKVALMGMGGCTRILAPAGQHELGEGRPIVIGLRYSTQEIKGSVIWLPGWRYFYSYGPRGNVLALTNLGEPEGQAAALKCRYVAPLTPDPAKAG